MKWFSTFSLKRKFIILSALFLSIALLLTCSITLIIKNLLLAKQVDYATANTLRFKNELAYTYKKIATIYDFLQFDPNIELLFLEPFSSQTKRYINAIDELLLTLGIMNDDLADIALVHPNFSYSTLFDDQSLRALIHTSPVDTQLNSLGIHPTTFRNLKSQNYLVFHKNIFTFRHTIGQKEYIGDILISINPRTLSASLAQGYDRFTYFMIIDASHTIYPFNCTLDEASSMLSSFDSPQFSNSIETIKEDILLENTHAIAHLSFIPELDYAMVSVIDKDKLLLELSPILLLSSLVIALVVIFICIVIYLILSNVLSPLHQMYLFMKDTSKGNLKNLKAPLLLKGSTEVTSLASAFNVLMSEITSLNKQLFSTTTRLYELEIQKNKAEILHLRSQINPHFLYNTLESVRGLAIEKDAPEIAEIALCMGKIFNYSIKGSYMTTLKEELAMAKSYLAIQLIRFNYKFEVFYHHGPTTECLYVPKMILQPLIENAIFHGLEPKLEPGILYISSIILNDALHITIQDDGVGMPKHILDTIQTTLYSSSPSEHAHHLGILNVHHRIFLEYGAPFGLSLESSPGIGTQIKILLPIINKEASYVERYHC